MKNHGDLCAKRGAVELEGFFATTFEEDIGLDDGVVHNGDVV